MSNTNKLLSIVNVNLRFNDRYKLQYIDDDSYNKILDLLSVMRKSNEITSEDYRLTKGIYKHFNSNFYKIKNLEFEEPRRVAQKFIGRKKIRNFIFNRDKNKCLKCGCNKRLQIDHIIPIYKGGENKISNLQTLCGRCNSIKRDNYADYRK